jgi:hypothetical protein
MTDCTEKVVMFELRRDGEVLRRWYSIYDPEFQHYLGRDDDSEYTWIKQEYVSPNGKDAIIKFASHREAASELEGIHILREAGVEP